MWTWVGRVFGRGVPAETPVEFPEWARRPTPDERDRLLLELLDEIGGPAGARAATRLHELVQALRMSHRVRVDEMVRRRLSGSYPYTAPSWWNDPAQVRRLSVPAAAEGAVFGLLSSVPSGYAREAAVQRLALVGSGDELPPLLLRANDWVAPVRERALEALRARLVPGYAPHWVRALRLVLRLRETGRGDTRPLVSAVMALLHRDDAHGAVFDGMYTPDALAARACFTILLRPGAPDFADVVRRGLGSEDIVVRTEAARAAAGLEDGLFRELLPGMIADRFIRVRMEAMELAARRMGRAVLPELRPLLLDRSAAVRARARSIVGRMEEMDFAAFYRDRITSDRRRVAEAVAGLGETGAGEDAEVLRPMLAHEQPRVRAAAVRALARLAGDRFVPRLVAALGETSPRVSRAAAEALRPRVRRADGAALEAWFGAAHPAHVRGNALALLAARDKWEGLAHIVRACADADPRVRERGLAHLRRWRERANRSFTRPTDAQQARIRAALDRAGHVLDRQRVKSLRFLAGIGG